MDEVRFPKLEIERWMLGIHTSSREDYECKKAMIEFCTNYEPELFQTFYKWFRKEKERKEN